MSALKPRDVKQSLNKKGFVEEVDKDHIFYFLVVDNVKTNIRTKVSHGADEIDDDLILLMYKQMGLNKKEFINFVHCPLTYDKYISILKKKHIL